MTLKVSVDPATEARLRAMAEQAGQDIETFVAELVQVSAAASANHAKQSAEDFDRALDELFAADTRKLPHIPLTYSREDIYFDHD